MQGGAPLIEFRNVTKRFGSTEALSCVGFAGHAGSVHAITGENGAGKSTLMKLIAGVHRPDSGADQLIAGTIDRFRRVPATRSPPASPPFFRN